MSSFIEFQAIVLNKLCSIENRLNNIESALGIDNSEIECDFAGDESVSQKENSSSNEQLKDDIAEFHESLADIKSLFTLHDN